MRTYFYEPSTSSIACPLVIAPKATAPFIRLCGDYRPINSFISIPQEPIPHVQQSLAKAAGWKIFVDLDMTNSFHQIPIDDFSSNLLSVSTPWGLFRPKFLPEGVGPASGILQSIVRRIFTDFDDWIIVIFDNFLILAIDYYDAHCKLDKVLQRCQKHGLVLKMKKSWIGTDVVTFFGYEVHPGSWQLSDARKAAISSMIFPTTQKQMQSFLGAAKFFHTHIPNFASWASALYECTAAGFNWDSSTWKTDYKHLFELFKTAITESVILHFPDYSLPWIIRSDSSDHAVGAVLFHRLQRRHLTPTNRVPHTNTLEQPSIRTPSNKKRMRCIMQSLNSITIYVVNRSSWKPTIATLSGLKPAMFRSLFVGAYFCRALSLTSNIYRERIILLQIGYHACILCLHHNRLCLPSRLP